MDKVDLSAYGKPAAPRVSPGGVALPQEKPDLSRPDLSQYGKPAGASLTKYAEEGVKAVGAGVGQTLLSGVKGAAVLLTDDPAKIEEIEHKVKNIKQMSYEEAEAFRQSMPTTYITSMKPNVIMKYQQALYAFWKGDSDKGNRYLKEARAAAETRPVEQQPAYQQADEFSKDLDKPGSMVGPGRGWEDSTTREVGKGLGSVGAFALTYPVGGVQGKIAGGIATAIGGAVAGTSEQYDQAKGNLDAFRKEGGGFTMPGEKPSPFIGLSPEEQQALVLRESKLGAIPGASEVLPTEILLKQLANRIPGLRALTAVGTPLWKNGSRAVGRVAFQALAEGGQEGFQKWQSNFISSLMTNPNQELTEEVLHNIALGAVVGGGIQTGVEVVKPFIPGRAPPVVPPPVQGTATGPAGPTNPAGPAGPGAAGPQMPPMGNGAGMAPQPQIIPQGQLPDLSKFGRPAGPAPGMAPMAPPPGSDYAAERARMNKEPTPGQMAAGNYQKGHVKFQGFNVSMETARGEMRRSKDPKTPWEVQMPVDYGYIRGTKGADGEKFDVFVGPDESAESVFVVDQLDLKTGKFDEHKAVLGARDAGDAMHIYESSFSDGKGMDRIQNIVEMPVDEFRAWVREGEKKTAISSERSAIPLPAPITPPTPGRAALPEPDVDGPVPDYLKDNNASAVELAKKLGLTEKIGELAKQGKTAAEISAAIEGKLDAAQVRSVRDSLGIAGGARGGMFTPDMPTTAGPSVKPDLSGYGKPATPKEPVGVPSDTTAGPSAPRGEAAPVTEPEKSDLEEAAAGLDALFPDEPAAPTEEPQAEPEYETSPVDRPSTEQTPSEEEAENETERVKPENKPAGEPSPTPETGDGRSEESSGGKAESESGGGEKSEGSTAGPTVKPDEEPKTEEGPKEEPKGETTAGPSVKPAEETKGDETEPKSETTKPKPKAKSKDAPAEKVENAGEELHGSRKEYWGLRGLGLKDYDQMNGAERAELVTKSNVWPRPDYADLVEKGTEPKAAYLLKLLYDGIPTSPINDHTRKEYILAVELIRAAASGATTLVDMKLFHARMNSEFSRNEEWRDQLSQLDSKIIDADDMMAFLEHKRHRGWGSSRYRVDDYLDSHAEFRAAKEIAKGWPNMEGWKRFFEVTKTTVKEKDGPVKDVWRVYKGYFTISQHDTEAEAIKAAEAAYETMMSRRGEDGLPVRPRLDSIKRTGPDMRQGKNVTSDDFMNAFGFRGVRFGDWVDNTERQKIVNLGFDALHDLATALGVPPQVIGLDGKIGLALGSHGRGGRGAAAAHYEPSRTIINLTKMNGAGSVAHEWGHAFDHYLGELNTHQAYGGKPKSISGWQTPDKIPDAHFLPPKARAAAKELMENLYRQPETNDQMRDRLDKMIASYRNGLADWVKSAERDKRAGKRVPKRTTEQIEIWSRKLQMYEAQRADPRERHRKSSETDYFKNAKLISGKGDYWIQGTEMFARAFEAYVFDTIIAKGHESQYLVQGVEETRFAQGHKGNPYPAGEERKRINELFTALLDALEPAEGKKGISKLAGAEGGVAPKIIKSDDSVPLDMPETPIDIPMDQTPELVGPGEEPQASEPAEPIKSDDKVVEAFRVFFGNIENSFSTITEAQKFAYGHGFRVEKGTTDNKLLQEKIELALVLTARDIAAANPDPAVAYKRLVGLYARQPNLGARTSESVTQQAYSTPVPLAFLSQNMAGVTQSTTVYEPTAGNGALIFMADPRNVRANELNAERAKQLRDQGYVVSEKDATELEPADKVDVVMANPPFGTVRSAAGGNKKFDVNGWETTQIDHAIALKALAEMKDGGKAVLIIGSVKDGENRAEAYNGPKRSFFWRLYETYKVTDHFTVSGDMYRKQGAGWPVDVIVIEGKGKSKMSLPSVKTPTLYTSWEELNGKIIKRKDDVFDATDTEAGKPSGAGTTLEGNGGRTGSDGGTERPTTGVSTAAEPGKPDGLRNEPDRGPGSGTGEQQSGKPGGKEVGSGVSGEPAGLGKPASDLELSGTFANIIEQLKKERDAKAAQPGPPREEEPSQEAKSAATEHTLTRNQTVASELASAAKETLSGLDLAATGLFHLFNDPDKVGAGPSFDEETYAKAKPFFEKAWQHFKAAATDVATAMNLLMRHMMETMNWTIEKLVQLEPYIIRFVKDKAAEGAPVDLTDNATQKPYQGQSKMAGLKTLVPTNIRDVTATALDLLREEKGDIDTFVSEALGYSLDEKSPDYMGKFLGGEQVDAIGLGIAAAQKGKGFIIGDQTGIGKGRVIAGMMRYALKNGMSPVFVTHKPNLYGDIIRDLNDLEVPKMAKRGLNIFITNRDETIPLDEEALRWFNESEEAVAAGEKPPKKVGEFLKSPTPKQHAEDEAAILKDGGVGLDKSFDMVFTTYNQMQTVKGKDTNRRALVRAIGPNSFLLMDESHNAGGDEKKRPKVAGSVPDAATFLRGIAGQAKAVMFSSATYAKRPHTMGLYGRTDMGLAVDKISQLGDLISAGGVPMQQIVASMLTKAGQYVRRERSFEGIRYEVEPVAIVPDAYNKFSRSVRDTFNFDVELKKSEFWKDLIKGLKPSGSGVGADNAVGEGSASSTNFTSIMHNLVAQMLLSIKADSVAELAITAIKNGEKPVITVSGTMGAFIENTAETLDLAPGDKLDISFKDVAKRYLRRVMRITVKEPQLDGPDKVTYYQVEPDDLPFDLRQQYDDALESITAMVAEDMPLSPIDWIKFRIKEAGYNVGEITGRKHIMDYTGKAEATYQTRSDKEVGTAGRVSSINRFNNESKDKELHALVLNRAGSTGLSLHASSKFKNQKPRLMIIAQAEGNIDEHMQLLGRINRTGQTVLPRYLQAYADIPAEARPAAILAKKMASLNANTTASRRGAFSGDEDIDFNNMYGDQIVYQMMAQDKSLQTRTNISLPEEGIPENLLAKFTGKLTVFEIDEQQQILDAIRDQYKDLIAELDAAGENQLEAKTEDLRAKTTDSYELKSATGTGPFQQAVNLETVEIKSAGRAFSTPLVIEAIEVATGLKANDQIKEDWRRLANLSEVAKTDANVKTKQYWLEKWAEHGKTVVDTFKNEETRARHRAVLVQQREDWKAVWAMAQPGSRVNLTVGDNEAIPVVVLAVNRRNKETMTAGSDPLTPGSWTVTFAMPDNSQQLIVPFSSIGFEGAETAEKEKKDGQRVKRIFIGPPRFYDNFEKLSKIYDAAAIEGKEIRNIVTGNILAAFDQVKGKGQILNYTTEDGTVQPGVLMPRAFKKDKFLSTRNVQLGSGRQVLEFLKLVREGAAVLSRDLLISINMLWNGHIKFAINKSKSKGGVYYENPAVKDITGTMGESGQFFVYQTNDQFKVEALSDALLNAGAMLEVNEQQDTAKGVVDKFPTQTEAEGQMKGEIKARENRLEFFRSKTAQQREALKKRVEGIAQRILGHRIAVTFTLGSEVSGSYWEDEREVVLDLIEAGDSAIGTLGHEAIHALRNVGVISPEEWALLRADALKWEEGGVRVIDMVREEYADYADQKHLTAEQLEDLFEEEVVAGLMDQYLYNREQNPPVRTGVGRIIDKIKAFINAVRDLFVESGLKTSEEVMQAIYEGRMANRREREGWKPGYSFNERFSRRIRPPRNPAPGSFQEPQDEYIMTALRDQTATWMERIGRALKSGAKTGIHNLQDERYDVKRTDKAIADAFGAPLPENISVYGGATLYPTRTAARHRTLLEDYIKPLIQEIAGRGLTLEQVNKMLIARHVSERNQSIGQMYKPGDQFYEAMFDPTLVGGSGWSQDRADAVIQNAVSDGSYHDLMMVTDKVLALNRMTLDALLAKGLISQDVYDELTQRWQFYVPLRGEENVINEEHPDSTRKGRGFDTRAQEFMQAFGRLHGAENPLGYSILQARQAIDHIENNRVAQRVLRQAIRFPNDAFWKVNLVQMKKSKDKGTGLVKYTYDRGVRLADEDFAAKVNGKVYHITLYHEGYRNGMKNMGKNQMNMFFIVAHKLMRTFTAMNTGYNPTFLFTNFLKDLQQAGVFLQEEDVPAGLTFEILKMLPSATAGVNRMLKGDTSTPMASWAKEFELAGGKMGFMDRIDIDQTRRAMETLMAEANPTAARKAWMLLRDKGLGTIDRWNDAAENTIRLSLYVALRQRLVSKDKAARAALEITVNFHRKGKFGPFVNALYAFFNARVQGIANMVVRGARSPRVRKVLIGFIFAGLLQDILNRLLAGDDDDGKNRYDKIPFTVKKNYFIYMLPKWMEDAGYPPYLKFPSGHGLNLFYNIGTILGDATMGNRDPMAAAANMADSAVSAFDPFGAANLMLMLSPTLTDPFMEISQNENYFGEAIEPRVFDDAIPHSERYKENVSPAARDFARWLNSATGGDEFEKGGYDWSPEWIEHVAGFATGGVGRFFGDLEKAVQTMYEGEFPDSSTVPIFKVFLGQDPKYTDRDAFYEIRAAIAVAKKQRDAYVPGTPKREKLNRQKARELSMIGYMKVMERVMDKERKLANAFKEGNAPDKRERIKEINDRIEGYMREVRLRWNKFSPETVP